MFGAKAEIAAHEKGLDVELIMVPFEMKTLYQPKHPDVLRINPKRQVPVLIDGDLELFDSTQIFEYFESVKPEPPLWPADPRARARARLLEHKRGPPPRPSKTRWRKGLARGIGWPGLTPMPTSPSIWRSSLANAWARP